MRRCSSDAKLQFISIWSAPIRFSASLIWISKYLFLASHFSGTLLPDEAPGLLRYFFSKCFFTHFRRSLYQVRDSYSIWEIDSIYLWYFFWIQPFSEVLFARFYLTVLCIWNYVLWDPLSFGWCFSGWHLINISLPEFLSCPSFLIRYFLIFFFPDDCSVFFNNDLCIRSFLQEIRFLSLSHIDGCYTTFPMDSP